MFRDDELMVLALERFESATTPVRSAGPKDHADRKVSESSEGLRTFSLMASEGHPNELANLGLVKTSRDRDDLAILGLVRLSNRRPTRFGI